MRSANSHFAFLGAPYLFGLVQLAATTESLLHARLIHDHFSHFVKIIVVVPLANPFVSK